jgi:hypothetical protein
VCSTVQPDQALGIPDLLPLLMERDTQQRDQMEELDPVPRPYDAYRIIRSMSVG